MTTSQKLMHHYYLQPILLFISGTSTFVLVMRSIELVAHGKANFAALFRVCLNFNDKLFKIWFRLMQNGGFKSFFCFRQYFGFGFFCREQIIRCLFRRNNAVPNLPLNVLSGEFGSVATALCHLLVFGHCFGIAMT